MHVLPETDVLVLTALSQKGQPVALMELSAELKVDQSKVTATSLALADQGLLQVDEETVSELRPGPKLKQLEGKPLPERRIIEVLHELSGSAEIPAIARPDLPAKEVGQSLRWLQAKGWGQKEGKTITLTAAGEAALAEVGADERLLTHLWAHGAATAADLAQADPPVDLAAALKLLEGRSGMVDERQRTVRRAQITDQGRALVQEGITFKRAVTQLTSEMLLSGEWREVELKPYDVSLAAEPVYPGKEHPLVSVFQQTRRVFLELGFEEIVSPYVESSFWDFDALFQPQDHPARDMQDTFYIARPETSRLPAAPTVEAVRRTHEDGGDTGSVGWRYSWDQDLAQRPVLRTHTTASTIRALAADPKPPRKVFCVGPVFRRETVDYKHLPVFHQVDGVIIDDKASFASLLGTLEAFYRKMGFDKFQFRPAFFPYTEPSVEIFVWLDKKQDWVEMGGAGMFRPEVTRPLGCTVPVLAWGLGLERLAMFRYDLPTISELYRARLAWLKETPLCR